MSYAADVVFLDISHEVASYDIQQGAFLLLSAYKNFPKGTIHVLMVDVFSGNVPRVVLAERDGYFFVAPDNGILTLAFGDNVGETRLCGALDVQQNFKDWINIVGGTIASIKARITKDFVVCDVKGTRRRLQPQATTLGIDCNILYIDRYENVVLDITRQQFEAFINGRPFRIKVMRMQDIDAVSSNYNDVPEGEPLCRFNSADYLEIALNHAPAASLLGLSAMNLAGLRYQSIRIFLQS